MSTLEPERPADPLERLLQLAGPRPEVPERRRLQALAAVEDEWASVVRGRRTRRRLRWAVAAAALAAALAGGALWLRPAAPDRDAVLARVVGVVGEISDLSDGATFVAGSTLETGAARVALRVEGGQQLRLDRDSRLIIRSADRVVLERGALYFDSADAPGAGFEVTTPAGTVFDVGTRYAVRVASDGLRVRVRDGHVRIGTPRGSHEAPAGTETSLDAAGRVARSLFPAYGPEWDWTLGVAPMPEIDGRPLRDFLEWAAREGGFRLAFTDARTPALAAETRLSGSVAGHTLLEALDAVLPASGMRYRVEDDLLIVTGGDEPAR